MKWIKWIHEADLDECQLATKLKDLNLDLGLKKKKSTSYNHLGVRVAFIYLFYNNDKYSYPTLAHTTHVPIKQNHMWKGQDALPAPLIHWWVELKKQMTPTSEPNLSFIWVLMSSDSKSMQSNLNLEFHFWSNQAGCWGLAQNPSHIPHTVPQVLEMKKNLIEEKQLHWLLISKMIELMSQSACTLMESITSLAFGKSTILEKSLYEGSF